MLDFYFAALRAQPDREAIVWRDSAFSYAWLLDQIDTFATRIEADEIIPGMVVGLEGDFTPNSLALLLALIRKNAIVVPLSATDPKDKGELLEIAETQAVYRIDAVDIVSGARLPHVTRHPHYATLRERGHPGLVVFSSGTSGKPKGAVHDLTLLLDKFRTPRPSLRTLNFLLFDHWGGLNTMFHTLSNAGTVLSVLDRSPEAVCRLIAQHRVELLPVSPSFLNLLVLSGAYQRHDLSSLKVISYGAEPMPPRLVKRVRELFPAVKLKQTYGLIEVGVLPTRGKSDDSLWLRIGGEGCSVRVVDGMLQLKTPTTMLGYLNAPSPFTGDGWYMTGDAVEVDGEYLKILGRKSELIFVGGEKVYPAEVEDAIGDLENVVEVTVYGEKNAILGNVVCARVTLAAPEDLAPFMGRMRRALAPRLAKFKIPMKVTFHEGPQYNPRFKKQRDT